jgi:hypothetical protein
MSSGKPKYTRTDAMMLLKTKYQKESGRTLILFDDHPIGNLVHFGRYVGASRSRTRTVYASRIYGTSQFGSVQIEVEGPSTYSVMNKVAIAVAKASREGKVIWQGKQPEPLLEVEQDADEILASGPKF